MKKIMIVGTNDLDKSLIANYINQNSTHCIPKRKFGAISYSGKTIIIPTEYLECPWMYSSIIATQQQADMLVMLRDARSKKEVYPPGFAQSFRIPIIGIITNSHDEKQLEKSYFELQKAGIKELIFDCNLEDETDLLKIKKIIEEGRVIDGNL